MATRYSFGIACCRYNTATKRLEVLMVKKRYTFYYAEFIFGHYAVGDDTKIVYLMNRMSAEEKTDIESMDFDRMWYRIWMNIPVRSTIGDVGGDSDSLYDFYCKCRAKFIKAFISYDEFGNAIRSDRLVGFLCDSTNQDSMWEIPKGKRNQGETELSCAVREFTEETGLSDYRIIPNETVEMKYANNKASYSYKYFISVEGGCNAVAQKRYKVGRRLKQRTPRINFKDRRQITEISDIKWMSLEEIKLIDQTKRFSTLVSGIFKVLRSRYKLPSLTVAGLVQ